MKQGAKDTPFYQKKTLHSRGKLIQPEWPWVMGIINVTPDSFYPGSRARHEEQVTAMAEKMISDGADILDVGGYSSRPGADDIDAETEMGRVLPVMEVLGTRFPGVILSIDTFRPEVARRAVELGAGMINDISGGQLDPDMLPLAADLRVPYVFMHMRGTPRTMKQLTQYDRLIPEMALHFSEGIKRMQQAGISDIILDPGIGFAKSMAQNFEILKNLSYFNIFGLPLMVGVSRKSLIYKTLRSDPENALNGTTVLHTMAILHQASILRTHDVKEAREVIQLLRQF
jgi:dihydropteroate synthase